MTGLGSSQFTQRTDNLGCGDMELGGGAENRRDCCLESFGEKIVHEGRGGCLDRTGGKILEKLGVQSISWTTCFSLVLMADFSYSSRWLTMATSLLLTSLSGLMNVTPLDRFSSTAVISLSQPPRPRQS